MANQSSTQISSCGKFGGSVYASALFKAWAEESQNGNDLIKEEEVALLSTSDRLKSYTAFKESVDNALHTIDKLTSAHEVRFAAQDNDWILVDLDQTSGALLTVAESTEPRPCCNCYPSTLKEDVDALCSHTASLILGYGSVNSAQSRLRFISNSYLGSFPGRDCLGPNTSLHTQLRRIITGKWKAADDRQLCNLLSQVEYRMNLMSLATNMLQTAEISLPDQLTCHEFDCHTLEWEICKDSTSLRARKCKVARKNMSGAVLPYGEIGSGNTCTKSRRYLSAALALDDTIRTAADLSTALRKLEEVHSENVATLKKFLERDDRIQELKQAWFQELAKTLSSEKCVTPASAPAPPENPN